jgi:hypothetical protein
MTDSGIAKLAGKNVPTKFAIACFIIKVLYKVAELLCIIFATLGKGEVPFFEASSSQYAASNYTRSAFS